MNKRIIGKPLRHTFYLLCLIGTAHPACATDTIDAGQSANDAAVKKLLTQAGYWHSKAHDDMALEALQKVLAVDEHNVDAMYLTALYQLQRGNTQQAEIWRKKMAEIAPQDPRLSALNSANLMQSISPSQLNAARTLAQRGQTKEAVAAYRALFKGNPPDDLALEYYQTMAGDSATWSEGVAGLRQRVKMMPDDNASKQALAMALTWQQDTRREGIAQLSALAADDKSADKALQQALLWLEPKASDLPVYTSYAQRHPEDNAPMDHYRKSVEGDATKSGFDALNSGDLDSAKDKFSQVLQGQASNGNALAGMGYVALRQSRFADAEKYLRRASQEDTHNENSLQWAKDADNARFYASLNQARSLTQKGRYADALASLDSSTSSDSRQRQAADMLRADILRRQGKPAESEQVYRQLLADNPQNTDVRTGLMWVLRQQNKQTEADQILRTLPANLRTRYATFGDNGDDERKAAQSALQSGNGSKAMQILQAASGKYPQNVWLQLDYARQLRKAGQKQQAATLMASVAQRTDKRNEALYAAAVYAAEDNDWSKSQSLLSQAPLATFSADMTALNSRVQSNLQMDIAQNYLRQGNTLAARNSLRSLERTPPQTPVDLGRYAQLMMQAGDSPLALQLVRENQAQGLHGTLADYAGQIRVLNQAGRFAEAESVLNSPVLQNSASQQEIDNIRIASVIARADQLREKGKPDAAWNLVMPALRANPANTDLLLAMARVYQSDHMDDKADEIYTFVLRKSPRDKQALTGIVNLALARNDHDAARRAFSALEPSQDADYMMLAARVAAANGESQRAMSLLRTAQWRLQQGTEEDEGDVISDVVSLPSPTQQAQQTALTSINNMMQDLQDKTATWTGGGVSLRSRSGESGLGALDEVKAPLTISGTITDSARLSLNVSPVSLNAGEMSSNSANRFGSGPITHATRLAAAAASTTTTTTSTDADAQSGQQANGVETNLSLTGDSYKLDIGNTPTGGQFTRLVGGVEWMPKLSRNSSLDLKAERRAVTDSLLSYVGAKDKSTGESWGAVTRNGVSAQYAWDNDLMGLYARLGFDTWIGENVPTNHSVNALAGSYLRLFRTTESELKMGVNVNYMDFDRNLSNYTLGQGGYFSPQNYMAVSLPVTLTRKVDKWDLTLNGAVGYQSWRQDQSDYFPGHSSLQSQLNSLASTVDNVDAVYKASAKNGVGYTLSVDARYRLNDNVALGANLGYDTFGSYNEGKALFYFKYFVDQNK
uniref:Cellulose synthase subunit C n=1 Tax=Enterobacteriaceae bacterium UMI-11 TaxID=1930625 RepID=A0A1Z4F677_9ENTR|nr:cellulose synthase subunit C [Enterobacteriaceae bacterium UMI-11]